MDKNLYRVSFRPELLNRYPRLNDFFETVRPKDRAQAFMAMGEAFAMTYAREGTDPQHVFYLAESVISGDVPIAVRSDKPISKESAAGNDAGKVSDNSSDESSTLEKQINSMF